jgi:hypothetical protein
VVLTFILFQVGFLGSLGTSGLDVWQKRVGWLVAMNRLANCCGCSRRRRCCSKRVMAGERGANEEEGGARGGERRDSEHVYSAISALLAHYFQSSSNQHIYCAQRRTRGPSPRAGGAATGQTRRPEVSLPRRGKHISPQPGELQAIAAVAPTSLAAGSNSGGWGSAGGSAGG